MASIENINPERAKDAGLPDEPSTRETSHTGGSPAPANDACEALFCNISSAARDLMALIVDLDDGGDFKHALVLRTVIGRIGWMPELGYAHMSPAARARDEDDASRWLLNSYQAKLLGLPYADE